MADIDLISRIRNCRFSRSDLEVYAAQTGLGRGPLEKDFAISILLLLLGQHHDLERYSRKMVFTGGTCIKKMYYPKETRFSEDLDFSDLSMNECRSFRTKLGSILVGEDYGVTSFLGLRTNHEDKRALDFQVDYLSLLGQQNHIEINLSTTQTLLPPRLQSAQLDPYFEEASVKIQTMDIMEITAEKTRALLQRTKPRDIFDVWFLVEREGVELDMDLVKTKLMRSYEATPTERKASAAMYRVDEIASRVKTLTERRWKIDLGGLMMRPIPHRKEVLAKVVDILRDLGNIRVGP